MLSVQIYKKLVRRVTIYYLFCFLVHAEWINSSVSIVTLEQRISRLGQYINEGQWRHQLVSTCCDYEDLEDDVFDDQSGFFSDDSDLDLDVGKSEGKMCSAQGEDA